MAHKIQITVNDELDRIIKMRAQSLGLSVSSFARLALINSVKGKNDSLLEQAFADIEVGDVEKISLSEFKKQLADK